MYFPGMRFSVDSIKGRFWGVLTIVYNTQNHRVSGLSPSSGILKTRITAYRKQDMFPSSDEGRNSHTLLGSWEWLRLALSKGPNRVRGPVPSSEDGNTSGLRNVMFSSF
jgi:hypothetical protein